MKSSPLFASKFAQSLARHDPSSAACASSAPQRLPKALDVVSTIGRRSLGWTANPFAHGSFAEDDHAALKHARWFAAPTRLTSGAWTSDRKISAAIASRAPAQRGERIRRGWKLFRLMERGSLNAIIKHSTINKRQHATTSAIRRDQKTGRCRCGSFDRHCGNDGRMDLRSRMGRAAARGAHLAELREATRPIVQSMASMRASHPTTLLVRSS
jgi:hypothetical protein